MESKKSSTHKTETNAKNYLSIRLYVDMLRYLQETRNFHSKTKLLILHHTYQVVSTKPEISRIILLICDLFMAKHFNDSIVNEDN